MSLYKTENVNHLPRRTRGHSRQVEMERADQERYEREASRRRNEAQARIEERARDLRIKREGLQKATALELAEHIRDWFPMDPETYRKVFAVIDVFEGRP